MIHIYVQFFPATFVRETNSENWDLHLSAPTKTTPTSLHCNLLGPSLRTGGLDSVAQSLREKRPGRWQLRDAGATLYAWRLKTCSFWVYPFSMYPNRQALVYLQTGHPTPSHGFLYQCPAQKGNCWCLPYFLVA